MSLPPGRYFLNAYRFRGDDLDQILEIDPPKEILLTANSPEVDLGVLRLPEFKLTTTGKKTRPSPPAAGTTTPGITARRRFAARSTRRHAQDARSPISKANGC